MRPYGQSRVLSWAGPEAARVGDEYRSRSRLRRRGASPLSRPVDASASRSRENLGDGDEGTRSPRQHLTALKRQRSADDADTLRGAGRALPMDLLRVDVELCGQLLVMRRREAHLANVLACLSALTGRLADTNRTIRAEYTEKASALDALRARAGVLQDLEAARARADALTQEAHALAYESAQFRVDELWHMAAAPRNKVLAMRAQVFGTGRRVRSGSAAGRFSHVQWTLDGAGRRVDAHGRTESEAEEEEGLPPVCPALPDEEDVPPASLASSLKPTWLLRMFNYWSRWGARNSAAADPEKEKDKDVHAASGDGHDEARTGEEVAHVDGAESGGVEGQGQPSDGDGDAARISVSSSGIELRSPALMRNRTT